MKATDNFFEKKRSWSKLKDEILMSYLPPYLTKISKTTCPIIIADCFAGKGRFDDGQIGSSLIIAEAVRKFKADHSKVRVNAIFVEKKYFKDLQKNLCSSPNCALADCDYEKWAVRFADENRYQKKNLLLYVDPYGIKPIPFQHFKEICDLNFNSVELLLNFNSIGFLREGCRLLGLQDIESDEDTEVYEKDDANSIPRMNRIANGDYWQEILREYSKGGMDTKAADGLLLVADKMSRTWKEFLERTRNGQLSICKEFDFPDTMPVSSETPEETIWTILSERHELKNLLVKLIEKFGIAYSESELKDCCKRMEKEKAGHCKTRTGNDKDWKNSNFMGVQKIQNLFETGRTFAKSSSIE